MSYLGYSWWGNPSADMQSVYFTAPADLARWSYCLNLLFCSYHLIWLLIFKSKLIFFYDRVVYYHTRIFLIVLPYPVGCGSIYPTSRHAKMRCKAILKWGTGTGRDPCEAGTKNLCSVAFPKGCCSEAEQLTQSYKAGKASGDGPKVNRC